MILPIRFFSHPEKSLKEHIQFIISSSYNDKTNERELISLQRNKPLMNQISPEKCRLSKIDLGKSKDEPLSLNNDHSSHLIYKQHNQKVPQSVIDTNTSLTVHQSGHNFRIFHNRSNHHQKKLYSRSFLPLEM